MLPDPTTCYAAMKARDARYDGRFFTGVRTTGIYCRPVCPARTPKSENVTFYASAAAASEAGFRACLRCRPETAPGTPAWRGTEATVGRALRLIDDGALDTTGVPELAARLGIGDRQLRKLFRTHLGATPTAVALGRRLHAARLLLASDLPIAEVASLAGFRSVRRFNDAVHNGFGRTPTQLRLAVSTGAQPLALTLATRPPLPWDSLLAYLQPRAIPELERVEQGVWSHRLASGSWVSVRRIAEANRVEVRVPSAEVRQLPALVRAVRRQLDLDVDPDAVSRLVPIVPLGLRLPGAFDPFVTAIRILLGQQVSVAAATTLSARLVQRWGYPDPAVLAHADVAAIGIPQARARTVRTYALAVASKQRLDTADQLQQLKGIGPWSAQMLAMRVLGDPDAFPATDLILKRACPGGPDPRWRPFSAYAAMALWRQA